METNNKNIHTSIRPMDIYILIGCLVIIPLLFYGLSKASLCLMPHKAASRYKSLEGKLYFYLPKGRSDAVTPIYLRYQPKSDLQTAIEFEDAQCADWDELYQKVQAEWNKQINSGEPPARFKICLDDKVPLQAFVNALNICKKAGVSNVHIGARTTGEPPKVAETDETSATQTLASDSPSFRPRMIPLGLPKLSSNLIVPLGIISLILLIIYLYNIRLYTHRPLPENEDFGKRADKRMNLLLLCGALALLLGFIGVFINFITLFGHYEDVVVPAPFLQALSEEEQLTVFAQRVYNAFIITSESLIVIIVVLIMSYYLRSRMRRCLAEVTNQ
jgi:hypothetical protein